MKIKSVKYSKKSGTPKTVTVEMTVDEAGLLYAFTGHIPDAQVIEHADGGVYGRWLDALYGLNQISGDFFNVHWDEGSDAVVPQEFAKWYGDLVRCKRKMCESCGRPCDWPNDYCHCTMSCEVRHDK